MGHPVTCRVCGRRLRTATSQARGAGPVCWAATRPPTPASVRIPAPAPADHIPGQAALPLQPMQPTLWSL